MYILYTPPFAYSPFHLTVSAPTAEDEWFIDCATGKISLPERPLQWDRLREPASETLTEAWKSWQRWRDLGFPRFATAGESMVSVGYADVNAAFVQWRDEPDNPNYVHNVIEVYAMA